VKNPLNRQSGAILTALLVTAPQASNAIAKPSLSERIANGQLAFLSEPDANHQPAEVAPAPAPDRTAFDGRWAFTSAGCPNTGSLNAIIKQGRIIVRGGSGQVSPDGTLHSVGAGGGMTLTAEGRLSGEMGPGTFDRSDGCSGNWIAIKRRR
jgi:hypothetical protein